MKTINIRGIEYTMEEVEQVLRTLADEDLDKVADFKHFTEVADMASDILVERHDEYIGEFNESMKALHADMVKTAQESDWEDLPYNYL